MKRCSICKISKRSDRFGVGRKQCNPCRSARELLRYKANATAINSRQRRRWKHDSEYRERRRSADAVYRRAHRAEKKQYDANYSVANRCKIAQRGNAYYHRNKLRIRKYLNDWQNSYRKTPLGRISMRIANHRRRERIRETSDGSVTAVALLATWNTQGGRCALCDIVLRLTIAHIDHIYPIGRGGHHIISNIQWTCATCNLKKQAKTDYQPCHETKLRVLPY